MSTQRAIPPATGPATGLSRYLASDQATRLLRLAARYMRHPTAAGVYAAIAFSIAGAFYFMAGEAAGRQQNRIDESRAILAEPLPDAAELEASLFGWRWSRDLALESRIDRGPDSDILDAVLSLAVETGLDPFSSGVRDDAAAVLDGVEFRSTPFFMKATGELEDIERFLAAFESGAVRSAEIQHSLVTESDGAYLLEIDAAALSEFPVRPPSADAGTPTPAPATGEAAER